MHEKSRYQRHRLFQFLECESSLTATHLPLLRPDPRSAALAR
ncbi:Uncharacterised protein [Vibrio cholerae]|nr:Uncharacterised protein [Vibrio cholerae]